MSATPQDVSAQMPSPAATGMPNDDHLQAFINQYQGELDSDTQGLKDLTQQGQPEPFTQQAPERNTGIMSVAPFLIGLAALGGKATGLHATTMLGATNGMVKGLIQGSEQAYTDHKKAYDEAYNKWLDKWTQQQKIYTEMRQVYKGRIDADLKALQFARQVTGDNAKVTQNDLKNHQNAQVIADKFTKTNETIRHDQAIEHIQQENADRKQAQEGAPLNPKAAAILSEATAQGIPLPAGSRSAKVLNTVFNSLADRYPNDTPEAIVARIRSGEIDMKVAGSEAQLLGRKEAGVAGALTALTDKGGFFEQLDTAAKKINFGDSKTLNDLRLAAQGKVVANPDIVAYRNKLEDTKAELVQVLSRSGVPTESVRRQANDMFHLDMSYGELQAAMKASKEVAQSVLSGNEKVIAALKSGKSLSDVLNLTGGADAAAGPKEGDTGVSKSNKPTVFRNGRWEYQ
jgi:hypothetical protein